MTRISCSLLDRLMTRWEGCWLRCIESSIHNLKDQSGLSSCLLTNMSSSEPTFQKAIRWHPPSYDIRVESIPVPQYASDSNDVSMMMSLIAETQNSTPGRCDRQSHSTLSSLIWREMILMNSWLHFAVYLTLRDSTIQLNLDPQEVIYTFIGDMVA